MGASSIHGGDQSDLEGLENWCYSSFGVIPEVRYGSRQELFLVVRERPAGLELT
jgi:hypothetical protein